MSFADAIQREAKEDLYYGQVVIIVSRWSLIVAGILLSLWSATSIADISLTVLFMATLMAMNFYLHGRYLVNQPVNARLVYLSSGIDLVVITLMVIFWTQGGGPGIHSPFFVFLYPALLAFGLVFQPRIAATYSGVTIVLYALVVLLTSGLPDVATTKALFERVVTLGATAGLGTYFWRVQRARRRGTRGYREQLLSEIETLTGRPAIDLR